MVSELRYSILILVGSCLCRFCYGQVSELQGSWKGTFKDSLQNETVSLNLTGTDSQNISGVYQTNLGTNGTVAIKPQGNGFKFILTQATQGCSGSFMGEFGLAKGKIDGTYSGTDCKGWHENGVISMTRVGAVTSPSPEGQGRRELQNPAE